MPTQYKDWAPMAMDTPGLALDERQDWYVAACVTRDSSSLGRSNWRVLCKDAPEGNEIHRFGHWACGHLEVLLVPPSALEWVNGWEAALSDYPVADESDLSEVESDDQYEAWVSYGQHDYLRALVKEHGCERAADMLTSDDLFELWAGSDPQVEHDNNGPNLRVERAARKTERRRIAEMALRRRALGRQAAGGAP